MRWKAKEDPKEGERRIVKRFALFPIRAGFEWCWLETVYIMQEYAIMVAGYNNLLGIDDVYEVWENLKFVDTKYAKLTD